MWKWIRGVAARSGMCVEEVIMSQRLWLQANPPAALGDPRLLSLLTPPLSPGSGIWPQGPPRGPRSGMQPWGVPWGWDHSHWVQARTHWGLWINLETARGGRGEQPCEWLALCPCCRSLGRPLLPGSLLCVPGQSANPQYVRVCPCAQHFSCVCLFATRCTVVSQAALFMGFSRLEYWSGLPCPPPGGASLLRDRTCVSCTAGVFFTAEPQGKPTSHQYLRYIDKSCQGACVGIRRPVSSFWHADMRGECEFSGHLSLPVNWASFHTSNSFDMNYLFMFSNHTFFICVYWPFS